MRTGLQIRETGEKLAIAFAGPWSIPRNLAATPRSPTWPDCFGALKPGGALLPSGPGKKAKADGR